VQSKTKKKKQLCSQHQTEGLKKKLNQHITKNQLWSESTSSPECHCPHVMVLPGLQTSVLFYLE